MGFCQGGGIGAIPSGRPVPDDLRVMVIEEEEKMRRAVEGLAPPAQMVQVSQLSTLGCSRDNKDAIWRANSK